VGDGEAVTYRVRLKLDGKTIDETELRALYFWQAVLILLHPYLSSFRLY
jgi:hypothetical protein